MSHTILGITLVRPDLTDLGYGEDWVKILQPDWEQKPAANFLEWLALNGYTLTLYNMTALLEEYMSECNGDGVLEVELHIHKSREDLAYILTVTRGILSDPVITTDTEKETVEFAMEDSKDLGRFVDGLESVCWEGPVYDENGQRLANPPLIEVVGATLTVAFKVIGTARIKYRTTYELYILTIDPSTGDNSDYNEDSVIGSQCQESTTAMESGSGDPTDDDVSEKYRSTAIATWDGGETRHNMILPDMNGNCDGGVSVVIDPDDEYKCFDRIIEVNACDDTEKVSDTLVPAPCPEEE